MRHLMHCQTHLPVTAISSSWKLHIHSTEERECVHADVIAITIVCHTQINCDGEPLNEKKYSFSVLPKRLLVHMPDPKLLAKTTKEMKSGHKAFHKKVAHTAKRPFKERPAFWQNPAVSTPLTYSAAVGLGVVLTLGAQRLHQRRASEP